jgi:hypothetical protein
MKKPGAKNSAHLPAQPIELVCVSPHKHAGPLAKEPDKLTTIRGKWAWCPSGAQAGHDWKPVASGSFNDLRVQLAEVSRLVDVALNTGRPAKKEARVPTRTTSKTNRPRSRGKR